MIHRFRRHATILAGAVFGAAIYYAGTSVARHLDSTEADRINAGVASAHSTPIGANPRAPLRGMLLGQPLGTSGSALPSGGLHPCASNPEEAKQRVTQFFGVVRQPVLTEYELQLRAQAGYPALVHTQYLPETISAATVASEPGLHRVELPSDPDIFFDEDSRRYPHIRTWYVLDCPSFEYLNLSYGNVASSDNNYPFGDIGSQHLLTRGRSRTGTEQPPDSLTFLSSDYVKQLALMKLGRPLSEPLDLADVVDLLYRFGRIPLTGFNSEVNFVNRRLTEQSDVFMAEDSIQWIIFDDIVNPDDGTSRPPSVSYVTHVIIYDRGARTITHHVREEGEVVPSAAPHVCFVDCPEP